MIVRAVPATAALALLFVSLLGEVSARSFGSPESTVEAAGNVASADDPPSANAPVAAEVLLRQMNSALEARAFSGTLIVFREGRLDALRIERLRDAGEWSESISSLSGELVTFERGSDGIRVASAGQSSTWPSLNGSPDIGTRLGLQRRSVPAAHYELVLYGTDRVAGRSTRVVDIRPRDGFRYGYRLWLDLDSSLPLKSLTIGADGRPIEQFMFSGIEVGPMQAGSGVPQARAISAPDAATATSASRELSARWQVLDAPDGFSPIIIEAGDRTHLLFTDGVAQVSVYIEPLSTADPNLSGQIGRGAMHAFGRVAHGQQIIVMGEVPAATVERLAQGLVPVGDPADR